MDGGGYLRVDSTKGKSASKNGVGNVGSIIQL